MSMFFEATCDADEFTTIKDKDEKFDMEIARKTVAYKNLSNRFLLKKRSFKRQYAHLYAIRLLTLRPLTSKAAKAKWGKDVNIRKLCELETGEKCVVIGTLYKDMQYKPSILKQIADEQGLVAQPVKKNFVSESDSLVLEDELQRIVLQGDCLDVPRSVTGCVVAVYGHEPEDCPGKFIVEELCWPEFPPQDPMPVLEDNSYVALVSGLELSSSGTCADRGALQLLTDLLSGCLGAPEQQQRFGRVVRVIVAGNNLSSSVSGDQDSQLAQFVSRKANVGSVKAVQSLDESLAQLSSCVPLDLMPGETDAANLSLPQQPLARCLLPQASRYLTLNMCCNPHNCCIDGVTFLGSSGQPVQDVSYSSSIQSPVDILERMLHWTHMAPTAPDTLACYPYVEEDPFVLKKCPHVFFTGNAEKLEFKTVTGPTGQEVLLVAVPRFSSTGTCCLVSLRDRTVLPLSFNSLLQPSDTI